jgi:hypothetical protein
MKPIKMAGRRLGLALVLSLGWPQSAAGSGHGPVFGAATPTLGRDGWSFDQAWMGRRDRAAGDDQMLRSMIGYGITEDLQITASLPVRLTSSTRMPMGRMMAMMSGNQDAEVLVGWRFHRRGVGERARLESTAYFGGTLPLESRHGGMKTGPSVSGSIATGYASREHYFWIGGGYYRPLESGGVQFGDVRSFSVVYGYRPPALRLDYPRPDLRFFVESVGEVTSPARHGNVPMANTGGHVVLTGPTALLLFKEYGISGGMLFPMYQQLNGAQPRERFRFGINFSYFFWLR